MSKKRVNTNLSCYTNGGGGLGMWGVEGYRAVRLVSLDYRGIILISAFLLQRVDRAARTNPQTGKHTFQCNPSFKDERNLRPESPNNNKYPHP